MTDSNMSVEYLGLNLKNPVIVSAGPWSRDTRTIKESIRAGAAAIVTSSIVTEASRQHSPHLFVRSGQLANIKLYSEKSLEDWKSIIGDAKDAGGVVIASIMGETVSETAYVAEMVQRFGADAIEIGAAAPLGEGLEIKCSDPKLVYEYTSELSKLLDIPVAVKLSATMNNPVEAARAAERGGASALSAIDAVRSLIGIDIETEEPFLPAYGGLSGPSIKPISLAVTSMISSAVDIPLSGIGGIGSASDAIEYIMAGASAVQIGSAILNEGFGLIGDIIGGIEKWMEEHDYGSINSFKGIINRKLASFQDLRTPPLSAELSSECGDLNCLKCTTCCMYEAVSVIDGKIAIDASKCSGCGICISACPRKIIKLGWND